MRTRIEFVPKKPVKFKACELEVGFALEDRGGGGGLSLCFRGHTHVVFIESGTIIELDRCSSDYIPVNVVIKVEK